MKKINIEITEEEVEVVLQEGASVIEKKAHLKDLQSAFSENQTNYDSGILPGEYGVHRLIKKGNREFFLYSQPARNISVTYETESFLRILANNKDIDYYDFLDGSCEYLEDFFHSIDYLDEDLQLDTVAPILVFMVESVDTPDGAYFSDIKMFAIKEPFFTGEETLYYPPFPNIYDNGSICWGDVTLSTSNPRVIQGLSALFFNSNFNSDLINNRTKFYQYKDYGDNTTFPLHLGISTTHSEDSTENKLSVLNDYMTEFGSTLMTTFESFAEELDSEHNPFEDFEDD